MLSPSTASIESERVVIVGVYIKIGFLQSFAGRRDNRECVRRGFFVIVKLSQKKFGFLQGFAERERGNYGLYRIRYNECSFIVVNTRVFDCFS